MPEWDEHPAPFDDGWIVHAPVGALRANAFGLHDVHGNVREWCLDRFAEYRSATPQPGDGRREPPTVGLRVTRGGSFAYGPAVARAAMRGVQAEDFSKGDLGLRAVRALSPEDFRTPGRGR
jgi:formylglycine-generating enzyme required for sulfatase activity